jgi:LysM repeat protein
MLPPDSVSRVPPPPPPPPPPPVKQVESRHGESLSAAGKRFGVSEEQITQSNPGVANANAVLPDNTRIHIPTGSGRGLASTDLVLSVDPELAKRLDFGHIRRR